MKITKRELRSIISDVLSEQAATGGGGAFSPSQLQTIAEDLSE